MGEFKKNRHTLYRLIHHLIVVTKYRHKCIDKDIKSRIEEITHNLFEKWNSEVIEINGEEDYIHFLFDSPSQINLANTINSYKTVTSRYIRKEFVAKLKTFYWKPYFWSKSYMVLSTEGAPIEVIKEYIKNQGEK